jgi:hypothetical protein
MTTTFLEDLVLVFSVKATIECKATINTDQQAEQCLVSQPTECTPERNRYIRDQPFERV